MTRYELVQILKMDGTYEEVLQAIEDKELTEQEHENILAFLQADNKEQAEQAFKKVMEDIDKAPIYTNDDEKKAWKDYRKELADEIYDMNMDIHDLTDTIKSCSEALDNAKENLDLTDEQRHSVFKRYNELKEDTFNDLKNKTIRVSALTLLDAEAKSQERQMFARERQELLAPFKEGLKQGLSDLKQDLKEFGVAIRESADRTIQTRSILDRSIMSSEHHILSWVQKSYMREANRELNKLSKARNSYVKQRAKAIKEANKILKKEYAREQNFNKIRSLAGKEVELKPLETVANFDRAMEILEAQPDNATRRKTQLIKWGINHYENSENKHRKHMDQALYNAKFLVDRRRSEIKGISLDAAQLEEDGRFSRNLNKTDRLAKWLANAVGHTQFSRDQVSDKMYDYLMSNGMSDLIQGNAVDWNKYDAQTKVKPKVQEVEEPVQEVSTPKSTGEQTLIVSGFPTMCYGQRFEKADIDKEGNPCLKIIGQKETDKYKTFNSFLNEFLKTPEEKEQFKLNVLQREGTGVISLPGSDNTWHWRISPIVKINDDVCHFNELSPKTQEAILNQWLEGKGDIVIKGQDLIKEDVLSNELLKNYEYNLGEKVVVYDCQEKQVDVPVINTNFASHILSGKVHDPKSEGVITFEYNAWEEQLKLFDAEGKELSIDDNKRLYEMANAVIAEREDNTTITITELNREFKSCNGSLTINGVEFNFQRDKNGEIDIEHPHDTTSLMNTDKILEQYGDDIKDAINDELQQVKERDNKEQTR